MPPESSFLSNFHSLAEPDEEVRCRAAFAIKQTLMPNQEGVTDNETLEYAVNRLIRGVQSSRQCARHGFGLALSEILCAFPEELPRVAAQIGKETALPKALKSGLLKERLLGRLFAYAAVLHAAPLWKGKAAHGVALAVEFARGLHEMFSLRPYMGAPTTAMMATMVRRVCDVGQAERVPELLASWDLDQKVQKRDTDLTLHAAGLVMELRGCYEDVEKAGAAPNSLKGWPACIRENSLAKPALLEPLVKYLGKEMAEMPVAEPIASILAPFCRWWVRTADDQHGAKMRSLIWPMLDSTLFPEKATQTTHMHSLRVMGELVIQLSSSAPEGGSDAKTHKESLLVGLCTQMPQCMSLMLCQLAWKRSRTHAAAVYANSRLVEALGAELQPASSKKKKQQKKPQGGAAGGKADADAASAPPPICKVELSDEARLKILMAVQQHKGFGAMPYNYQMLWQKALLAPLSPAGVRARCAVILTSLCGGSAQSDASEDSKLASVRVCATQLMQLTVHGKAPDDVILVVVNFLFTAAYLAPRGAAAGAASAASCSLKAFCSKIGFSIPDDVDDFLVPLARTGDAFAEQVDADKERETWREKFWIVMTGLTRKPLPDMVDKLIQTNALLSSGEEDTGDNPEGVVKTKAFHGCFSDGVPLMLRLHEWWEHVTSSAGAGADKAAASKKKKGKEAAAAGVGASLCCDALSEKDSALRRRCLELSRKLLDTKESDGALKLRKLNALCNLALCMVFTLCAAEDKEERRELRHRIEEVATTMTKVIEWCDAKEPKKKGATPKEPPPPETFGSVLRLAAELFVDSDGLAKEAARAVWREFGECIPEETLTSLSAAIRDTKEEEEEEEEAEDADDDADEEVDSAKTSMFQAATEALRKAREAEKAEGKDEEDEDEDDEAVLDTGAMLTELLGSGDEAEAEDNPLLKSFADNPLEEEAALGRKVTRKQMRFRDRQEVVVRKFRELDLVEAFLLRQAGRNKISIQLLHDVHETLMATCGRLSTKQGGEGEEGKKKRKKGMTDVSMRELERGLAQRIAKMLLKTLMQLSRLSSIPSLCQWRTQDEWAALARTIYAQGLAAKISFMGLVPIKAGALMLYLCCGAHAASLRKSPKDPLDWSFGQEMLSEALRDWTSKKDGERWCQTVLDTFHGRVPHVLVALPWVEQMKAAASKKAFLHRALVAFFADNVMRHVPSMKDVGHKVSLLSGFMEQCAEMLESTLATTEGEKLALTTSQKWRMRREALRGAQVVLRLRTKKALSASDVDTTRIVAAVTKVKDSLPSRRGEIYQVCLMVSRTAAKLAEPCSAEPVAEGATASKKRPQAELSSSAQQPEAKKRRESAEGTAVAADKAPPTKRKKEHA